MKKNISFKKHYALMLSTLFFTGMINADLQQAEELEKRVVAASCCTNNFADALESNSQEPRPVRVLNVQTFTSSGTYTPTANMKYCIVEAVGGGAGSGGCPGVANDTSAGAGAGAYTKALITASVIGTSQTVTIGVAGAGGASNATGNAGQQTTLGNLVTALPGTAGPIGSATATAGSAGGAVVTPVANGATLIVAIPGQTGGASNPGASGSSGVGGSSFYGAGGVACAVGAGANDGNVGTGYGAGASGSVSTGSAIGGSAGTPGIMIITEYC